MLWEARFDTQKPTKMVAIRYTTMMPMSIQWSCIELTNDVYSGADRQSCFSAATMPEQGKFRFAPVQVNGQIIPIQQPWLVGEIDDTAGPYWACHRAGKPLGCTDDDENSLPWYNS